MQMEQPQSERRHILGYAPGELLLGRRVPSRLPLTWNPQELHQWIMKSFPRLRSYSLAYADRKKVLHLLPDGVDETSNREDDRVRDDEEEVVQVRESNESEDSVGPDDEEEVVLIEDDLPNITPILRNRTPDQPTQTLVICPVCSCTHHAATECLRCEQDEAFRRSELTDRMARYRADAEILRENSTQMDERVTDQQQQERRLAAAGRIRSGLSRGKTIKFKFPENEETHRFPAAAKWKDILDNIVSRQNSTPAFEVKTSEWTRKNDEIDIDSAISANSKVYVHWTDETPTQQGNPEQPFLTSESTAAPYQYYRPSNMMASEQSNLPEASGDEVGARLQDILRKLKSAALNDYSASEVNLVEVRRSAVVEDVIEHYKFYLAVDSTGKLLERPLKVKFVGETGVDLAGLGRELGTLFIRGVTSSHLVQGTDRWTLSKSQDLLHSGSYRALGMALANHAVQCGIGVPFLTLPVIEQVLLGRAQTFTLEDIPDRDVQDNVRKLMELKTDQELALAVDGLLPNRFEWRVLTGTPTMRIQLSDVQTIVRQVANHLCILNIREELMEFSTGLNMFGLLDSLKGDLEAARAFFSPSPALKADWFRQEVNVEVQYSPARSNSRRVEEGIYMGYSRFVQSLEVGHVKTSRDGEEVLLGLSDLLQFWCALDRIPPQGMAMRLYLEFTDPESGPMPTANTCAGVLRIPRLDTLANTKTFLNVMIEAIINSPYFHDAEVEV